MNKALQALNTKGGAVAIGIVGVLIIGYLVKEKAAKAIPDAAKAVGQAINPINDQNIFYTGVNAVGGYVSGKDNWNLGSAIYDWTH
jgi:hypothetical protein